MDAINYIRLGKAKIIVTGGLRSTYFRNFVRALQFTEGYVSAR